MECPNCHQANPADAKFCGNCGVTLTPTVTLAGACINCGRTDTGDGHFCKWCQQFLAGPKGVKLASIWQRFLARVLEFVLFILTLVIGYVVWMFIAFGKGQTPGKQLLGIRAMKTDGTKSDWGWTFLREFVVKFLLFAVLGQITFGLASAIDDMWALWDKDKQTLHDKIVKTYVVDDREYRKAATP